MLFRSLKQAAQPQVFTLPPIAAYQHRLVFDLYPAEPVDPLEALIAERLRDTTAPAAAATASAPPRPADKTAAPAKPNEPADPLGDLIAQHADRPGPSATPAAPTPASPSVAANRPGGRATATQTDRIIIVALDPGHGGEDPGAIGPAGTREKDVVLRVAHLLRDRINATTVGGNPMRAFLTRDGDYFVPLGTRVEIGRAHV